MRLIRIWLHAYRAYRRCNMSVAVSFYHAWHTLRYYA